MPNWRDANRRQGTCVPRFLGLCFPSITLTALPSYQCTENNNTVTRVKVRLRTPPKKVLASFRWRSDTSQDLVDDEEKKDDDAEDLCFHQSQLEDEEGKEGGKRGRRCVSLPLTEGLTVLRCTNCSSQWFSSASFKRHVCKPDKVILRRDIRCEYEV